MSEEVAEENTKICCMERGTFIKAMNMLCGVGMVVFGIFNIFQFVTAGS